MIIHQVDIFELFKYWTSRYSNPHCNLCKSLAVFFSGHDDVWDCYGVKIPISQPCGTHCLPGNLNVNFHMGIRWHLYLMEQNLKSVIQMIFRRYPEDI